jgi:hypothetical protein
MGYQALLNQQLNLTNLYNSYNKANLSLNKYLFPVSCNYNIIRMINTTSLKWMICYYLFISRRITGEQVVICFFAFKSNVQKDKDAIRKLTL